MPPGSGSSCTQIQNGLYLRVEKLYGEGRLSLPEEQRIVVNGMCLCLQFLCIPWDKGPP